jgi:N-acetylmuramic acid 6-phosphate (MurNAc-6-P) etherase
MIQDLTDLGREEAVALLEKSDRHVKLALLMHWTRLDAAAGEQQATVSELPGQLTSGNSGQFVSVVSVEASSL